jgi:hypothetical protein
MEVTEGVTVVDGDSAPGQIAFSADNVSRTGFDGDRVWWVPLFID